MSQRMQQRRDTAANWTSVNPILLVGEIGLETDTLNYKIGDGVKVWSLLPYKGLQPVLQGSLFENLASDPSTPDAGFMYIYTKATGGRTMPKFKGPSGLDSYFQPALFGNGVQAIFPGASTAPLAFGGQALTNVGTVAHPVLNATSLVTQTSRWIVTSAATANSVSDSRIASTRVWRGNSAGVGGFFHRTRFSIESTTTNQQMFIGFQTSTAAFATTQVPSAIVNCIGVGFDSADTSLQIMNNDASGTATKTALGSNFPNNDPTAMFDFTLFCAPNDSQISYTVTNLKTGNSVSGTLTTDLPVNTTFLSYRAYMNNGGTAASVILGVSRMYIETDY